MCSRMESVGATAVPQPHEADLGRQVRTRVHTAANRWGPRSPAVVATLGMQSADYGPRTTDTLLPVAL